MSHLVTKKTPGLLQAAGNGIDVDLPKAAPEKYFSIKQRLSSDFGFDLPISGTFPEIGLRTNPICIHSSDFEKIIEIMYLTVHGMNLGIDRHISSCSETPKHAGVLWRPHPERWIEYHPEENLYSFCFERTRMAEDSTDGEIARYFFELPDAIEALEFIGRTGFPSVDLGSIRLPRSIGVLHCDPGKSIDYAKEHDKPHLGFHAAFFARGITASIYNYPIPSEVAESEEALELAFEQAISEIRVLTKVVADLPIPEFCAGFKQRAWIVGEDAQRATAIGMTATKGRYVKYRATWVHKNVLDQAVFDFMANLKTLVQS
jgi:hypothetical protein